MSILKRQSLRYTLYLVVGIKFILFSGAASAACDCRSTDQNKPCTGNSISVTVQGEKGEKYRTVDFSWSFNSGGAPASCGQFANGDYWIAPAPGKSSVTLTGFSGKGSGTTYLDENPTPESMGFLTVDYGNLNKDENLTGRLPVSFSKSTSLVASMQRNEDKYGCGTKGISGSCTDAYNVLTVLDSVPEKAGADMLRPNITRASKELITFDDIELSRFPRLNYFSGTDDDGLETIRSKWTHHVETLSVSSKDGNAHSEGGRAFRADLVTNNYGAGVAAEWHEDLTTLMSSSHSLVEIKPALAAMLTYGKDLFHVAYGENGLPLRSLGSGAGQWMGRFPTIVFFAAMAKDPKYANTAKLSSSQLDKYSIHELTQLNLGPNGPVWGDNKDIYNQYDTGRYWGEMLTYGKFDGSRITDGIIRGKKTFRDPYGYIDGPGAYPGLLYASVSAGPIKAFAAEMLLMPEMCEITNYDAVVDYAIRITDVGIQTANDPCAPPDPRESTGCSPYYAKNCKYYGLSNTGTATWGPNPNDLTQCIKNGTDPITGKKQNGRFGSKHGEKFDIGYPVSQVENNWSKIRGNRDSCRNQDKPKPPTNFRNED